MKSIIGTLLFAVLMASCSGPSGPPGPPGPRGQDGINILSEVFEITVNFNQGNNFNNFFPLDPPIFDSDVVLIYLLWEVDGDLDVWRPLPQTLFLDEGLLQYNYDFTAVDLSIFLETTFDISILGPQWTNGQTFRIVLVPGEFMVHNPETLPYNEVMEMIGKTEDDVRKLAL